MRSFQWQLVSVFAAMTLLMAACGSGSDEADPPPPVQSPDSAEEPGEAEDPEAPTEMADASTDDTTTTVTIGIDSDITGIDGQNQVGLLHQWVLENAFDSIMTRDGLTGQPVPHVVTEWSLSDDEQVWTLHLRDDVVFHNGDALTAEDVKASVDRIRHPDLGSSQAGFWADIDEAVVIDDYTIEFRLSRPNALLMVSSDRLALVPKSWAEEVGNELYTGDDPVGVGAYRLVEWRRDDRIVFEAFDDYFLGRPEIDRIVFRPMPDESTRVAALRSGEVDIIFPVSPHLVDQINAEPDLEIRPAVSMERVRLSFDTREPPWDVRELRLAVNYAIDTTTIAEELVPGSQVIPAALVPQEIGFNPDLEPYPYDPGRARELLEEAGFGDGIGPVELSVNRGYPNAEEVGQAIASYLDEVGIATEIRTYDAGDFNTRKGEKNENPGALGPLMFDGHSGGNTFHGYHHFNGVIRCDGSPVHSGYYCNPDIDALTNEALAIWGADQDRAVSLFQQAEETLQTDPYAAFLFQTPRFYGTSASLDWQPDATGQLRMSLASWND